MHKDSADLQIEGGYLAVSRPVAVRRDSPMPLYLQIKREVLRRILSWPNDERRFYSDEELCSEFDVSRMTVRQAIKELVDEGYLTRARGLGTFLTSKKLQERPLAGSSDQLSFDGQPFAITILKFGVAKCPDQIRAQLELPAGATAVFVRRRRDAAAVPVSIDERWLPTECATGLTKESAKSQSLVRFLGSRYSLAQAQMQFEGGSASPSDAHALRILEGDPVLLRYLIYRTTDGRPVLAGHSVHRSDLVRYVVNVRLQD